jgi:hypothetical protein
MYAAKLLFPIPYSLFPVPCSLFPLVARRATDKKSFVAGGTRKNSSKLNEQYGNVYENKGPLWKTQGETGMSMKTQILSR